MTDVEPHTMPSQRPPAGGARQDSNDDRDDRELLASARTCSVDFGEFYLRHANTLFLWFRQRCGQTQDSYDLVSETFAEAYRCLHRFDPETGDPAAWLYGIAKNRFRSYARRGAVEVRGRTRLALRVTPLAPDAIERLEQELDLASINARIEPAIEEMPEAYRVVIRLRCIDGRSYDEIADILGIRPLAARKRVSRGLGLLADSLGDNPFTTHD